MDGSRFYDLRKQYAFWDSPRIDLPERITTPSGDSLERVSLKSASLCADFLVATGDIWAGVAVAVTNEHISTTWRQFKGCSPSIVRLIPPDIARTIDRYATYPGLGWVEVIWNPSKELSLIEVQTNEALWYAHRRRQDQNENIIFLALENLRGLMNEPEQPVRLP